MKQYLVKFLIWALEILDPGFERRWQLPSSEVMEKAKLAVLWAEMSPHTGSYKAAVAFKQLRFDFPREKARVLKLAVELAVQDYIP